MKSLMSCHAILCGVLRPMNMGLRELMTLERKSQANICVAKAIKKYEDRILSDPLLEEMRYTVNMDN